MAQVILQGQPVSVSSIYCIGRNYAAHIAELGNQHDVMPLVFLKPQSALLNAGGHFRLPAYSNDVQHECELVLLIGQDADNLAPADALSVVAGYALGLDLTARDIQSQLKQKGHPWTRAKGFRAAACVSDFVAAERVADPGKLQFSLRVNGEIRQKGDTRMMLHGVPELLVYLAREYGLRAGDLIFTGTPEGVAAIHAGDCLQAELDGLLSARWDVEL